MLRPMPFPRSRRAVSIAVAVATSAMVAGCTKSEDRLKGPTPEVRQTVASLPTESSTTPTQPAASPTARPASTQPASTHSATPKAPTNKVPTTRTGTNRPPVIGSVAVSGVDRLTGPNCESTHSRPTVTAVVTDPDTGPASLKITLSYILSWGKGDNYRGEVQLRYDAGHRAFRATLPALEPGYVSPSGSILAVSVTAEDGHYRGASRPITKTETATVLGCSIIQNG